MLAMCHGDTAERKHSINLCPAREITTPCRRSVGVRAMLCRERARAPVSSVKGEGQGPSQEGAAPGQSGGSGRSWRMRGWLGAVCMYVRT